MDPNRLTSQETVSTAHRAAELLGWGDAYLDLLVSTTNNVFAAHGDPDTLPISRRDLPGQIEVLRAALARSGRSTRTARTYASAWSRLTAIIDDLGVAQAENSEGAFWADFVDRYRDPRLARRRTRRVRQPDSSSSTAEVPTVEMIEHTIPISVGSALVVLPSDFTASDALAVIEVVARHAQRAAVKQVE